MYGCQDFFHVFGCRICLRSSYLYFIVTNYKTKKLLPGLKSHLLTYIYFFFIVGLFDFFYFFSDNYGFVTFLNKLDAYEAMEHGNDDPFYPKYDLSFGGRRIFCKTSYSDLGE